jgi:hypothetical protein
MLQSPALWRLASGPWPLGSPPLGASLSDIQPSETHLPCFPYPQVLRELERLNTVPDFNNYLAFIFSRGDALPAEVDVYRIAWAVLCAGVSYLGLSPTPSSLVA